MLRKEVVPSLLIMLMGTLDCVTTVMGVVYSGDKELNPVLAGVVSSDVGAFLAVKIGVTVLMAFTYVFARKLLMRLPNVNGRNLSFSFKILASAYGGIIAFLALAVANNLLILIR